jgi:hypothetical protein
MVFVTYVVWRQQKHIEKKKGAGELKLELLIYMSPDV